VTTLIAVLALVTTQAPAGWTEAGDKMFALLRDGNCPEAIAIGEQWVAKHPSLADAHFRLGSAYENVARGFCGTRPGEAGPGAAGAGGASRADRVKQFEKAAVHLRRAFELGGGQYPDIAIRGLIDIYGLIALDRPDEQEKIAREAVARYPAQPIAHVELITALLKRGADAEAAKAVAAARAAFPKAAAPQFEIASSLAFRATGPDRLFKLTLTREARIAMARMAAEMLDDVLAISPGHKQALRAKTQLVQDQAELANEPPLSARRPLADESSVVALLRLIASAQAAYSADCGAGFYAPTLAALAKPKAGERAGFFSSSDVPPNGAKTLERHRYTVEMTAPPSPKSPASCNGVPAGQSAQTWSAIARPLPEYSGKSYRIDAEGELTTIK